MTLNWRELRSSAKGYAIHVLIGGLAGASLGFRAALSKALGSAAPAHNFAPILFGASIGCLAGLMFWRLRRMTDRGDFYYFLPWGLSVGTATALVLLPTIVKTREWLAYGIIVALSVIVGLGLGAYFFLVFTRRERK